MQIPLIVTLANGSKEEITQYILAKSEYQKQKIQIRYFVLPNIQYQVIWGIDACRAFKVKIDCANVDLQSTFLAQYGINVLDSNAIGSNQLQSEDNDMEILPCPDLPFCSNQQLDDVNLEHLEIAQQSKVQGLLQNYSQVFSDKPGCAKDLMIKIKVNNAHTPIQCPQYKVPYAWQNDAWALMQQLLDNGIAEPGTGE